jgi:hypothetical protein
VDGVVQRGRQREPGSSIVHQGERLFAPLRSCDGSKVLRGNGIAGGFR